jgi:hypothetical protein
MPRREDYSPHDSDDIDDEWASGDESDESLESKESALGLVFYNDAQYDGLVCPEIKTKRVMLQQSEKDHANRRYPIIAEISDQDLAIEEGSVEVGDVVM